MHFIDRFMEAVAEVKDVCLVPSISNREVPLGLNVDWTTYDLFMSRLGFNSVVGFCSFFQCKKKLPSCFWVLQCFLAQ